MRTKKRARAMRADGMSLRKIGAHLGISHVSVFLMTGGQRAKSRTPLVDTDHTVVREFTRQGICSTTCVRQPISLPRIEALHGRAA